MPDFIEHFKYMEDSEIIDGRDGNGGFILRAAKDFDSIRQSYKQTLRDLSTNFNNTEKLFDALFTSFKM
jgi:hypothetical protein